MSALALSDNARWYCLRSQVKHEHIAAAHLRLEEKIEVFCPRVRLQRATRRGLVWFTEALFSNYLFARFDLSLLLARVQYSHGVAGILRFGDRFAEIPDAAVRELRRTMEGQEVVTVARSIAEGDSVTVIEGPLRGQEGVVTQVLPTRERVKVLLDFLGGATEIEVSLTTVFMPSESPLKNRG